MMKKITFLFTLLCPLILNAQILEDLSFGIQIGPGITLASIKDDLPAPSKADLAADGQTSTLDNLSGRAIRLMVNYRLSESFILSSGFHFTNRRLFVYNTDGSYAGESVYHANYVHLPILFKYRSNEIADYLRIIATAGPMFDLKTGEKNIGGDYAHFMNFAQNRFDIDNQRGRNGNNKPLDLFNGTGLSLFLGVGAEYSFSDTFSAYVGISYHKGLTNMLNSELKFNDSELTPITETTNWKTALLAFDFGVGFSL